MTVDKEFPVMYLNYSMEMGGIETLILESARRMMGNGISTSVGVFKGGGSLEKNLQDENIALHDFRKKEGVDFSLIRSLRQHLKRENIRILHTHNYGAWFYGILSSIGMGRIKHVHTEHSRVNLKRRVWIEKLLGCFTETIVCVSDDVKCALVGHQGIAQEKISVVYNGVDTERFTPCDPPPSTYKERIGISENMFVVGIVARLNYVKNHENLLKAFRIISGKVSNAILLIVGDGELKDHLEHLAKAAGLEKKVLFLGERQDIPDLLRAMDIFILCSLSEGHNISLIEAMSASLPSVVTAVGGNREVVLDGVTGYLVPSGDHQMLAEKIMHLLDDKSLRDKMGEKARESTIERFSVERMISDYRDIYSRLHSGN